MLASTERRGRPPKWPARHIADAVFYLLRSGCAWRMLPREYPPWQTVYYHFRKWRLDGRLRQAHERLRVAVREYEGRDPDPSGAVMDTQAVKSSGVGGPERGYDGAKRLSGRKRHLLWWTLMGWCSVQKSMVQVCTTETVGRDFSKRRIGREVVAPVSSRLGRCSLHGSVSQLGARRARLAGGGTSPSRSAAVALRPRGETAWLSGALPRRWVVERTFSRG